MSRSRTGEMLLRCYPPAWRARYGDELRGLIIDFSHGGHVPWRVRADVALAGARERMRSAGLGDAGAPAARVRGGALLVLCAWALIVVAGSALQKLSEHWQDATPPAQRSLPQVAFAAVVILAACGAVLVGAGIALALPRVADFLRAGGWSQVRGRLLPAAVLTVLAGTATVALVVWAHGLSARELAGHDTGYMVGFVTWALILVACLGAWTAAAVAIARRVALPASVLRVQARLACAVSAAMAALTAAAALWWAAMAGAAPWFLAGRSVGSRASGFSPELAAVIALMLVATLAGFAGARQVLRALPGLSSADS